MAMDMDIRCNAPAGPVASQEEDDKLFLATGFRYLPAFERGFPYPWCAKKSKKGWIVRDSPPSLSLSRQHPETEAGVEFVGWREAEKMFRSREILMQRVITMERLQRGNSKLMKATHDTDAGRVANDGPLRERDNIKRTSNLHHAVDDWFRQTQRVIQARQMQASEEEFHSSLNMQKKKYRSELKEELRDTKRRQKDSTEAETIQTTPPLHELPSSSLNGVGVLPPIMSPTRKKHKKMPPKPFAQLRSSVVLGEDPELDQMIEEVVHDFMHEFSKGPDDQGSGNARRVDFDGNAMSVLREAAKDTLYSIANQEVSDLGGTHNVVATDAVVGMATSLDKMSEGMVCAQIDVSSDYQLLDYVDGMDERISAMIEQLIGEAQHDTDCEFDQRALDALKEAAKEIVAMDKDVIPM